MNTNMLSMTTKKIALLLKKTPPSAIERLVGTHQPLLKPFPGIDGPKQLISTKR